MMRTVLGLLLVVALACPVAAFNLEGFRTRPNDQVLITLLAMVVSDLQMCQASIRPTQYQFMDNVLSIGHLNNAKSALERAHLDCSYAPLVRELHERIEKIRFYLVLNDIDNVNMRLNQLIVVIQTIITAQGGQVQYPQQGGPISQYPNNGGSSERPVGTGGVIYTPNFPGYPSTGQTVPVSPSPSAPYSNN